VSPADRCLRIEPGLPQALSIVVRSPNVGTVAGRRRLMIGNRQRLGRGDTVAAAIDRAAAGRALAVIVFLSVVDRRRAGANCPGNDAVARYLRGAQKRLSHDAIRA
jgi:hypothetical protein